jgi:hypothetical protein
VSALTRALSEERTHEPPEGRRRIARLAHDQVVHLDGVLRHG